MIISQLTNVHCATGVYSHTPRELQHPLNFVMPFKHPQEPPLGYESWIRRLAILVGHVDIPSTAAR